MADYLVVTLDLILVALLVGHWAVQMVVWMDYWLGG